MQTSKLKTDGTVYAYARGTYERARATFWKKCTIVEKDVQWTTGGILAYDRRKTQKGIRIRLDDGTTEHARPADIVEEWTDATDAKITAAHEQDKRDRDAADRAYQQRKDTTARLAKQLGDTAPLFIRHGRASGEVTVEELDAIVTHLTAKDA